MYEADNYEVETRGGYYGEEIDKVSMNYNYDLEEDIKKLYNCKNNSERIQLILNIEYGYVLDDVKNLKEWKVVKIDKISTKEELAKFIK